MLEKIEIAKIDQPQSVGSQVETPATPVTQVGSQPKTMIPQKDRWSKAFNPRKLQKPNTVAVLYLRNNGVAEPMEVEVKNGFIKIQGKTYHERADCKFSMGKERTPLAIIPEWSLIPVGTKEWEDKEMKEKFAELQDHTLKGIRNAELVRMGESDGKKMDTKTMILLGIAAIVAVVIGINYI